MRSSDKIQRAFHSHWQRTTVYLRDEIWLLINALHGKRTNWYVRWCVLQKHSVNKVATVSGSFCRLPGAGPLCSLWAHSHTTLHLNPWGLPIPPLHSQQFKSPAKQRLLPPLLPPPTPSPLLLLFGSGRFKKLSTGLSHYYQVFPLAMYYSKWQPNRSGWSLASHKTPQSVNESGNPRCEWIWDQFRTNRGLQNL